MHGSSSVLVCGRTRACACVCVHACARISVSESVCERATFCVEGRGPSGCWVLVCWYAGVVGWRVRYSSWSNRRKIEPSWESFRTFTFRSSFSKYSSPSETSSYSSRLTWIRQPGPSMCGHTERHICFRSRTRPRAHEQLRRCLGAGGKGTYIEKRPQDAADVRVEPSASAAFLTHPHQQPDR